MCAAPPFEDPSRGGEVGFDACSGRDHRLAGDAEVTDEDFVAANQEFGELMAIVPGLLAKVWLKNADEKVYGGIYLWRDRQACRDFVASELWDSVLTDDSATICRRAISR